MQKKKTYIVVADPAASKHFTAIAFALLAIPYVAEIMVPMRLKECVNTIDVPDGEKSCDAAISHKQISISMLEYFHAELSENICPDTCILRVYCKIYMFR